MATFTLTGKVIGFGGTSGNLPTLDLYYDFTIGNFSTGASQTGVIQTAGDDTFSVPITVPDNRVDGLGPRSLLIVKVRAYAPLEARRDANVTAFIDGTGQEIYDQAVAMLQDVTVEVDLTMCRTLNVRIGIEGTASELDGVNEMALHVVSDPSYALPIGSITARRDGAGFRGRVLLLREALDDGPAWLLAHTQRRAFPVGRRELRDIDVGRVIVRTRALTGASEFANAGSDVVVSQVDSLTGVGTISDKLPEVVNEGVLFVRDLDLDFVNGRIRVRGRVGVGGFGFQLFGIGRFEVVFSVSVVNRDLEPFRPSELGIPLGISIVSHTFDMSPDTDLDELNIAESALEDFLSGTVADTVRNEIVKAIRDELRDRIDEQFATVAATLGALTDSPDELVNEMRETLFVQVDSVSIDSNNLTIRAFVGLWHSILALQSLSCAANTMSAMFYSRRPMPMFRRYERAMSRESLRPWTELYWRHAEELSSIVARDSSLAGRVVGLAADLQPVLNEKGGVPLSEDGVERIAEVIGITRRHASAELGAALDAVFGVIRAGKGRTLKELVVLAEQSVGRSRSGEERV